MMFGVGIVLFTLVVVAAMLQRYKAALASAVLGLLVFVASAA